MGAVADSGGSPSGVRRYGLALVMVGALSVSVRGQVEAVWPLLGGMSIVLALTNDIAALLALNEVISTSRAEVRRWAWAVLLLAGGTAAGLNTWHALAGGQLPAVWAVVVGAGPVLLSMVLSHLVALASTQHPAATGADDVATGPVAVPAPAGAVLPAEALPEVSAPAPPPARSVLPAEALAEVATAPPAQPIAPPVPVSAATAETTSRTGQVAATLPGPGAQRVLAVVSPTPRPQVGVAMSGGAGSRRREPARPATAGTPATTDSRVATLVEQLHGGIELTGAEVGAQLGCSERTGRRLLRQAQDQLDGAPGERSTG